MRTVSKLSAAIAVGLILIQTQFAAEQSNMPSENWPQFLGPGGLLDAGAQNVPLEFGPNKNLLWRVRLPKGNSSPILVGDSIILIRDGTDDPCILSLDCSTGEELENPKLFFNRFDQNQDGAIEREELPPSRARDVFKWLDRNDNLLWELDEISILLRPPGKGRNIMVAVKPGGVGLLNDTEFIDWEWSKNLPYVASPVLSQNRIFIVKSLGIISCLNTETGKPFFEGRRTGVKGEYFASPIKVGDKLLIISSLGSLFFIKDSESFEILAQNAIDEEIIATPAIVDDTIYLRSLDSLWAFGFQ